MVAAVSLDLLITMLFFCWLLGDRMGIVGLSALLWLTAGEAGRVSYVNILYMKIYRKKDNHSFELIFGQVK